MPPFQSFTSPLSHHASTLASWNLKPRSSPDEAQPAGLIALGVCLGVALALVLIWYTCCRAQTGPLKEIQMYKRGPGSRMRKEIQDKTYDISSSYPSPIMMPPQAYVTNPYPNPVTAPPQPYGLPHSYANPATIPAHAYDAPDPYPNLTTAPPMATIAPEMAQPPPKAYTHHAMSYLDPALGGTTTGLGLRNAGEPEMTEVPAGEAGCDQPPASFKFYTERVLGVPVQTRYRGSLGGQVAGGWSRVGATHAPCP
ncbi:predicted protein [Chaetomium globosum CBS 148.51]|uniref:Uncharacterized protein n=1 Tax=Chaetomium globosum (strain ATCC 6205 / CBS 148.51 / DSM 1962 / NBRC 6347 / NRRL 1970) TaxID=306901 RepID=Q2HCH6_CHAGB|nr:uncharacterized protein CHGG_02078 [Chaetomium globosum CBS 148.51]EAQ93843.1 predicted protein [Chaetomium globosum CBS 148.51]